MFGQDLPGIHSRISHHTRCSGMTPDGHGHGRVAETTGSSGIGLESISPTSHASPAFRTFTDFLGRLSSTMSKDISFSQEERTYLESQLEEWVKKSKQEKMAHKETMITKILEDRQHDVQDSYARGHLKTVSCPTMAAIYVPISRN